MIRLTLPQTLLFIWIPLIYFLLPATLQAQIVGQRAIDPMTGEVQYLQPGRLYPVEYQPYTSQGYTCYFQTEDGGVVDVGGSFAQQFNDSVTCQRATAPYYSGTLVNPFAVRGQFNAATNNEIVAASAPFRTTLWGCPFIYFRNAPEGELSVELESAADAFLPEINFNQPNGWRITAEADTLTVDENVFEHLFYELAFNKITLSRHGENFSSKEALISYLNNSDFFTKLNFNEEERSNALGYILNEIEEAPVAPYYYLTVLSDEAVTELSSIEITPKPEILERTYFAVYPSPVPVTTKGTFMFPQPQGGNGFVVKETGELFVHSGQVAVFK